MDIGIFKRNIQLYKLGIGELGVDEQKLYDFLTENLWNIDTYISNEYPEMLYFGKNRRSIILCYDSDNRILDVYDKIWLFFRDDLYNSSKKTQKSLACVMNLTKKILTKWKYL